MQDCANKRNEKTQKVACSCPFLLGASCSRNRDRRSVVWSSA